jgi:predicted flap endonuclease-1-like 5' DNA nuclease
MAKIIDVEGIGEVYARKLTEAGIATTEALLEKGASAKGRKGIAEQTGISETLLLEWVNHVDLYRIKGVASEYADLLEEAGVDSIPELALRNPEHLTQKMVEVNLEKKLVRKLPVLSQVENWVEQAKKLPKIVTH